MSSATERLLMEKSPSWLRGRTGGEVSGPKSLPGVEKENLRLDHPSQVDANLFLRNYILRIPIYHVYVLNIFFNDFFPLPLL